MRRRSTTTWRPSRRNRTCPRRQCSTPPCVKSPTVGRRGADARGLLPDPPPWGDVGTARVRGGAGSLASPCLPPRRTFLVEERPDGLADSWGERARRLSFAWV